jgi:1,4-alpha-glucan branching enzyme
MRAAGARAGGPRSPATLGAPRSGVYASRFNAATRGWEAAPPGGGAPAAPGAPPPPAAAARGAPPADAADADADAAADGLGLLALDPELAAHAEHLRYRWAAYSAAKESVERHGGGLLEFAKGHERFGVTRAGGATVVREWCPGAAAAQLVGDFNGWAGSHMARDAFGVWSLTLPDGAGGAPAIAHGSRLKIRLQHPGGWWVDRVPGWIRVARAEPGVMAAKFDGIHWDPPAAERYTFRHPRPPRPASLRVYEAHVGMAAEAERVATYAEFRDDVLPRIAAAGYNAVQLMAVQVSDFIDRLI